MIGSLPQIELIGVDPASIGKVRNIFMSAERFLQPGDRGRAVVPAALADLVLSQGGRGAAVRHRRGLKIYGIIGLLATQHAPRRSSSRSPMRRPRSISPASSTRSRCRSRRRGP